MSYRLEASESPKKCFVRIVRSQTAKAIVSLSRGDGSMAGEAIHEARKRFKRLRTLMRLARFGLPHALYQHESNRFRDAGRPFSDLRDAAVLIETFDQLIEQPGSECPAQASDVVRQALLHREQVVRQDLLSQADAVSRLFKTIKKARGDVKAWPLAKLTRSAMLKGLKRIDVEGRSGLFKALQFPTDDHLHDWRKRVKDLGYALELLEMIPSSSMKLRSKRTKALSEALGKDHDLAVLHQTLAMSMTPEVIEAAKTILPMIDHRRTELQGMAFELGRQVYRLKSGQFIDRVKAAWHRSRTANSRS